MAAELTWRPALMVGPGPAGPAEAWVVRVGAAAHAPQAGTAVCSPGHTPLTATGSVHPVPLPAPRWPCL